MSNRFSTALWQALKSFGQAVLSWAIFGLLGLSVYALILWLRQY